jgi:iron complex outermembrane receptor protein
MIYLASHIESWLTLYAGLRAQKPAKQASARTKREGKLSDLNAWRSRLGYLCSSTALAAVLLATPAWAQATPTDSAQSDEIVVTAQRRAEASRDVPITVSTLSPEVLQNANVESLADTARVTTALRFDVAGTFVQPTIRGVGTAITTSGGGPNVGIYVDGFFQSNSEVADFQLMRTRNIQVLKGPQGTLFGRNTTGGAILVTTEDPSHDPQAEVQLTYGSFNTWQAQGYASYGVSEDIALDVEGIFRQGDGFQTNLLNGDDQFGAFENWSARAGALIDLSDDVSVLFRYIHSETNDPTPLLTNAYVDASGDADFFGNVSQAGRDVYDGVLGYSDSTGRPLSYAFAAITPGAITTDPDSVVLNPLTSFTNLTDAVQATFSVDLGWADLTSYTQYRVDFANNNEDLDATGFELGSFLFIGVNDETVSQEFLLTSKPGGPFQWTAGGIYYRSEDLWDVDLSLSGALPFGPFGGSGTTTTSYAAFFDATYEFMPNWFVTAGARYTDDTVGDAFFRINPFAAAYTGPDGLPVPTTQEQRDTNAAVSVDDLDNSAVTPRLVLRYKPNDESSIYASYTRGYKAGILNVGGLSQVPVEPEEIDAFEVGYKFDNGALSFDTAAYYYDYQNLQVSSFQNAAAQIRNAASSTVYGLEAQSRWQATDALNVYGGFAWTHAEYESFPNAPFYGYCDPTVSCGPIGLGSLTQYIGDASGFQMQRAPEWTANLGASYDVPLANGGLTFSGNLYYTSEFFFDPSEQFKQDGYTLVSLRAAWTDPSDRYTIAAFGDNVTDERYQTQVLYNTLGIGSVWSAPATWGVSVNARF